MSSSPAGAARTRFAAALNAEIKRLRDAKDETRVGAIKELAKALAAVDPHGSTATVIDILALPDRRGEYVRVDTAERLLVAGVVLPAATVFALADSILERTGKWMQDSDRYLLQRILALCPFADDPVAGISKVRDVLGQRRLYGHELRELVIALLSCNSCARGARRSQARLLTRLRQWRHLRSRAMIAATDVLHTVP